MMLTDGIAGARLHASLYAAAQSADSRQIAGMLTSAGDNGVCQNFIVGALSDAMRRCARPVRAGFALI